MSERDATAVIRAQLQDAPHDLLIEELARRGYWVVPWHRARGRVEPETTRLWDGEKWLVCREDADA